MRILEFCVQQDDLDSVRDMIRHCPGMAVPDLALYVRSVAMATYLYDEAKIPVNAPVYYRWVFMGVRERLAENALGALFAGMVPRTTATRCDLIRFYHARGASVDGAILPGVVDTTPLRHMITTNPRLLLWGEPVPNADPVARCLLELGASVDLSACSDAEWVIAVDNLARIRAGDLVWMMAQMGLSPPSRRPSV